MSTRQVEERERALGARLRELRIEAGLTQDELARDANLSRGAVQGLERGAGSSLSTLVKVLRVLGHDQWLDTLAPAPPAFNPLDLLASPPRNRLAPASRVRRARRTRTEGAS